MNSIVWFPDLKDNSEINMNWSKKLSAEQKKSQALVFGIIDPSLSKREQNVYRSRFLQSQENWKDIWIFNNKEYLKHGIIFKKIFSQYLIEEWAWYNSPYVETNKWLVFDFIMKSTNSHIKLWLDFTINPDAQSYNVLKQKTYVKAEILDQTINKDCYLNNNISISRQSDMVWCVQFFIPQWMSNKIWSAIYNWDKQNYEWNWKDYLANSDNIDFYFKSLAKNTHFLYEFFDLKNEIAIWHLEDAFDIKIICQEDEINVMVKEKWTGIKICNMNVFYTQKYYQKIWFEKQVKIRTSHEKSFMSLKK